MTETALVKQEPMQVQSQAAWTQEQIELIKRTVAKGTTNDELKMFMYIAQKYDLDPFVKEIWCIKRAKKRPDGGYDYANAPAIIMTSRDGYLKVAQRTPEYEGLNSGVVREGDEFEFLASEGTVKHRFGTKRGKILGAWAIAYRKGRKPVACFVDFNEYNDPSSATWQKYPSAMIQKVAEAFVLKRQFGISGLVTREEMSMDAEEAPAAIPSTTATVPDEEPEPVIEADFKLAPEPEPEPQAAEEAPPMREPGEDDDEERQEPMATEKQVAMIYGITRRIGKDPETWLAEALQKKYGVSKPAELTLEQAGKVIDGLKVLEKRLQERKRKTA